MSGPVANVTQRIIIEGVDNASEAVERAKRALGGFGKSADEARQKSVALSQAPGGGIGIDPAKLQSTTQRLGGAASALAGALGPAAAQIAEVGRSATALGSTAAILPGPIGLAAAAVVGLAAGAYLLGKNIAETNAKLALLGNADTGRLKEALDLDTNAAISLSQAMDDLKDKSLRPSDALLKQVVANAERMGKDGGEAAAKFVKALEGGPDALKQYQQEFGKLYGLIADNQALAIRFGLNAELLGMVKAQTAEESRQADINAAVNRLRERQTELARLQVEFDSKSAQAQSEAQLYMRVAADAQAQAARRKIAATLEQIGADKHVLEVAQAEVKARQDAANATQLVAAQADLLEARAADTLNKKERIRLTGEATTKRIGLATQALNAFDLIHKGTVDAKLLTERTILETRLAQADSAKLAAKEAAKQAASAGAQAAEQRRQALFDASLRLSKAQADRDGLQTEKERAALLDLERAKELDGAANIKNEKVRGLTRLAILEDFATKAAALERQIAEDGAKTDDEHKKVLEESNKRSADLAASAADAVINATKAKAASMAGLLRSSGQVEQAQIVELRQARVDYEADLQRIDKERLAMLGQVVAGSVDAANIESAAESRRVQAKLALADRERQVDQERADRVAESRRAAVDLLAGAVAAPAQALAGMDGAAGRIGKGIGTAATAAQKLASGWRDLKSSAADAISASASVAASFIDDQRAQFAVLALGEGAAALASGAVGNIVGALGHAGAAAAYAFAAGSSGGGGAGAVSGAGADTSATGYGGGGSLSSSGAAGPTNYTIVLQGVSVIGTPAQVGKLAASAINAAKGTGMVPKAKGV